MLRAIAVEAQKWRRTWFTLVTLAATLAAPLLVFIMFYLIDSPATWARVFDQGAAFHLMLTGPLTVVLIGAQMIAAEYQWDTWKLALTTSVPRWAIYGAKWLVGTAWVLILGVVGWGATVLVGVAHHASGSPNLMHWLQFYLLGAVLMSAMLPLHHLITLITCNFFVTSGFGIVATFAGLFIMQSKYATIYPLSGAMMLLAKYLGQTVPATAVGTVPIWVGIQVAVAAVGLLGSLLYTTRADYR
jgi:hypothetical protein